jgi:hypothetical protein
MPFIIAEQQEKSEFNDILSWAGCAHNHPVNNSIDINHYDDYILRIDCNQAESGIRTTPNSQRCLNALAIDNPLEYARLAPDGEMQAWVDAEDSLEPF